MRWQHKVCLLLLLVSWTVFLGFAAYHTSSQSYRLEGEIEWNISSYSWIWYHPEHWLISLVMSFVAALFGLFGLLVDIGESGWRLSDVIQIKIIDDDKNDLD